MKEDLLALAVIDADGQGFRYTRDTKGVSRTLPGEYPVQLSELRRLIEAFLKGVEQFVALGYATSP